MKKNLTKAEKEARSDRRWGRLKQITFNYLYPFTAGVLLISSLTEIRDCGIKFMNMANLSLAVIISVLAIIYQIKKADIQADDEETE